MNPFNLKLRGFSQKEPDGSWLAVCIDLNLVAQGDSQKESREKLHNMISGYLEEALTEDEKYFDDLVPRKSPFICLVRYYWIALLSKITHHSSQQFFTEYPNQIEK